MPGWTVPDVEALDPDYYAVLLELLDEERKKRDSE
jgi:hypothetical protein